MSQLRLVIVTRRFWPIADGRERAIGNLAAELVSRGIKVTLVTIRWEDSWPERVDYRGVPVVRLPQKGKGFLGTRRWLRNLSRYLRDHGTEFDAAYVCGMRDESLPVLKLHRQLAVVFRVETSGRSGDCLWQLESSAGRQVKRRALSADAFVAPTEIAHRELTAAGYPRDRIHPIFGGVPIAPPVDSEVRQAARQALENVNTLLHCPPGTPIAVYTGILNSPNGPTTAIDAWRLVVKRWPNARLWLVGAEADQSDLNRRIDAAGLTGRVVIPGVFANVTDLLAASDAAIVGDDNVESSALVLEAMAAGTPVVAANSADHRSLVDDEVSARLYPPDDDGRLGETLVDLFADPDAAGHLAAAARASVEQNYEIKQVADAHIRLLENLVQDRRD